MKRGPFGAPLRVWSRRRMNELCAASDTHGKAADNINSQSHRFAQR